MKVEDHNLNKERILAKISETNHKTQTRSELCSTDDGIKYVPITDRESYISNSDWNVRSHSWFKFALSERDRESFIDLVLRKFKKSYFQVRQDWFNQYGEKLLSNYFFEYENINFKEIAEATRN